jgi:hypothetical protein
MRLSIDNRIRRISPTAFLKKGYPTRITIGVERTNNSMFNAGSTEASTPSHFHRSAYNTQLRIMMFMEKKAEKPSRIRNNDATPPSPFSPVKECVNKQP